MTTVQTLIDNNHSLITAYLWDKLIGKAVVANYLKLVQIKVKHHQPVPMRQRAQSR
jgi:hypothetical protein